MQIMECPRDISEQHYKSPYLFNRTVNVLHKKL
jgi:hypothetical protein